MPNEDPPKHGLGESDFRTGDADQDALTTDSGEPVSDNQNSRSAVQEDRCLWTTTSASRRWPSRLAKTLN